MNEKALDGKTILITGASRGIGKALAKACAEKNAHVIACGRSVQDLEILSDEIKKEHGT